MKSWTIRKYPRVSRAADDAELVVEALADLLGQGLTVALSCPEPSEVIEVLVFGAVLVGDGKGGEMVAAFELEVHLVGDPKRILQHVPDAPESAPRSRGPLFR